VKRVIIIFLILGALIVGVVGCSPGGGGIFGGYSITISSTAGGKVTSPGEGSFSYAGGTVVTLVATPDLGYHFVRWTGNAGTIADVYAATTTMAVNNYYFVIAQFQPN
jgi:hypothetical protein